MFRPLQSTSMVRGMQSTTLPATVATTTATQLDIGSILNMMIPIILIVMVMKVMTSATAGI